MQTRKESALSSDDSSSNFSNSEEDTPPIHLLLPGLNKLKPISEPKPEPKSKPKSEPKPQTGIGHLAVNVFQMGLKKRKDPNFNKVKVLDVLESSSSSEDEKFTLRSKKYKLSVMSRDSGQSKHHSKYNTKGAHLHAVSTLKPKVSKKLKFVGLGKQIVLNKMHRLEEFIFPQFPQEDEEDSFSDFEEDFNEQALRRFFLGTPKAYEEYGSEMIDSCIEYLPKDLFYIEQSLDELRKQAISTAVKNGRDVEAFKREYLDEDKEDKEEEESKTNSLVTSFSEEETLKPNSSPPEEYTANQDEFLPKMNKITDRAKILGKVLKIASTEVERINFGEEQREKIIHTANVFRKERDLRVVSKFWKRWKYRVDKILKSEHKLLTKKHIDEAKRKKREGLIQKEVKLGIKKDILSGEDYYNSSKNTRITLKHRFPYELQSFIPNCNNIYTIEDDQEAEEQSS